MALDRSMNIADIVLEHPECARVFAAHRIDFGCGGKTTVAHVCEEKGLDPERVFAELETAVRERAGQRLERDVRALSTPALVAHVVDRHHGYLRHAMPQIRVMAAKVARVHGDHNPKLVDLNRETQALLDTLEAHLDHEERVRFPALMALRNGETSEVVARELAGMHEDHVAVGRALERIRAAADDYALPAWACTTYRTLFRELENMERDIHTHVHLENHVLMPRFVG